MRLSVFCMAIVAADFALAAPPTNDSWATRTVVPIASVIGAGFADTVNTIGEASLEASDPQVSCKIGDPTTRGNTVWYGLTTGAASIVVNLRAPGYNSQLMLVTGNPSNGFSSVVGGCNDDGAGSLGAALAGIKLAPNTEYSIQISRSNQTADAAILAFSAALATVRTVTKQTDSNDGSCDADCSLREAVNTMPSTGGAIEVPAGTYALTGARSEDAGAVGDLDFAKGIFFYGAGTSTILESAASADRIADIDPAGLDIGPTVAFFDLTIRNGNSGFGDGGCLRTPQAAALQVGSSDPNEYLVLKNVTVSGCTTSLGGGAIASPGSPIHVFESTLSGNTASSSGGAILFSKSAALPQTLGVIERSLVTNNLSTSEFTGGGGGIVSNGKLVVLNSTIAGNQARFSGGGILVTTNNGAARIENSTIAGNIADANGNDTGVGGGIRFDTLVGSGAQASNVQIVNSVFADNKRGVASAINQDCHATTPSAFALNTLSNWFETPDASCAIDLINNAVNSESMLATTLANNGGTTLSLLPMAGSPLINSTLPAAPCNGVDQRGVARPQGGSCDRGAVEIAAQLDLIFATGFE